MLDYSTINVMHIAVNEMFEKIKKMWWGFVAKKINIFCVIYRL